MNELFEKEEIQLLSKFLGVKSIKESIDYNFQNLYDKIIDKLDSPIYNLNQNESIIIHDILVKLVDKGCV